MRSRDELWSPGARQCRRAPTRRRQGARPPTRPIETCDRLTSHYLPLGLAAPLPPPPPPTGRPIARVFDWTKRWPKPANGKTRKSISPSPDWPSSAITRTLSRAKLVTTSVIVIEAAAAAAAPSAAALRGHFECEHVNHRPSCRSAAQEAARLPLRCSAVAPHATVRRARHRPARRAPAIQTRRLIFLPPSAG